MWMAKRYCSLRQTVKGQPTCDFLVALPFWRTIWTSLHHRYFFICTKMQDDARKALRMSKNKKVICQGQRSLCFRHFFVFCVRTSVSCRQFVICNLSFASQYISGIYFSNSGLLTVNISSRYREVSLNMSYKVILFRFVKVRHKIPLITKLDNARTV